MQVKMFFAELWPSLVAGTIGSAIGIKFGGNIEGGLYGALVYIFFTILCSPVVYYFSGIWIDEDYARIIASAFISSLVYILFYAIWAVAKVLAKKPFETIKKLRK